MGLLAGVALDMARLEQKRENERTRERERDTKSSGWRGESSQVLIKCIRTFALKL